MVLELWGSPNVVNQPVTQVNEQEFNLQYNQMLYVDDLRDRERTDNHYVCWNIVWLSIIIIIIISIILILSFTL